MTNFQKIAAILAAPTDHECMLLCYKECELIVLVANQGLRIPYGIYHSIQDSLERRAQGCPHVIPVFVRTYLLCAIALHKAGVIDLDSLKIPENPVERKSDLKEVEELKRLFEM